MIDSSTYHKVNVDASEQDHSIESVTVFQAGRAEVKRRVTRVQLQLKRGQTQIIIERLPSLLIEDSLRIQGTGTAVIFDVIYHPADQQSRSGLNHRHDESSNEEDEGETGCYNAVKALKKQRNTVENQISFLQAYGHWLNGQNSNMENLEQFLNMLDLEIKQAEKALRAAQKKEPKHKTKVHRRTEVTIIVMSEEEGRAELVLMYVVWDASWTPIYEI
ncbi:hypothetical protein RSOLAG1IB_02693 [Rhizoctonia solani AG-1 IB]|uniref:DUF4140 domain-containing protein n=1 Tax=Thanatephorus cucumeris (strain AG1-IB / isolate 7/3/14) TaxID=1108050 RepID=A0A0B7FP01_THACB|nr:hypothetical protein RSOLAG1IB_02693 [Rhizoctonia solani AG-1 IB]